MSVPHPIVLSCLRILLILWLAFIAWASLVRFNFSLDALTMDALWSFLDPNPFKARTGRASLAWDIGINVVLFMPIGVGLWLHNRWAPIARCPLPRLIAWAVLFSVGLQALQLLLPRRVASLSDAVWNGVGIVGGVGCAWMVWKTWHEVRSTRTRRLPRKRSAS